MSTWDMRLRALPGIPMVSTGDDIAALICKAGAEDGHQLADGDVLCVAQKIVSKTEGRIVRLADVIPSPRAEELAQRTGRDPRWCQLVLDESEQVLDLIGRHVVTLDRRGLVDTAGGVDLSNAGIYSEGWACLLPVDPDASARRIRDRIRELTGATVAVIVTDSLGGPHREGSHGAAIGLAGIVAVEKPRSATPTCTATQPTAISTGWTNSPAPPRPSWASPAPRDPSSSFAAPTTPAARPASRRCWSDQQLP